MTDHPATINISEIFASIQGEGRHIGEPSIFVRTSGCNLRCKWDDTECDTPYTSWQPESNHVAVCSVVSRVLALRDSAEKMRHVVITGGEPLLQPNIQLLTERLAEHDFILSVETNGTLAKPLNVDFVSLSPKLKSSVPLGSKYTTMHESTRYNREALMYWYRHYPHQFKFVVNTEDDELEIRQILRDLQVTSWENVYLMPQGISKDQLVENTQKCVTICNRNGWKYTPRLQLQMFGNVRGT